MQAGFELTVQVKYKKEQTQMFIHRFTLFIFGWKGIKQIDYTSLKGQTSVGQNF